MCALNCANGRQGRFADFGRCLTCFAVEGVKRAHRGGNYPGTKPSRFEWGRGASRAYWPRLLSRAIRENWAERRARTGSVSNSRTVWGRRYDQLAAPTEPGVLNRAVIPNTSVI